ncbi:MAG: lipopolysaccharide biosynthesis protein [Alistipes sp.]
MRGELRDQVANGMAWSIVEKAGSMLLQMVVSIVVARLLMPEDFGVMAILTVFSALALVVVDSGFSQTLIRKEAPTESDYRSVFRFNLITAVVLYGLLVALSPIIARFYDLPILIELAPVLFLLLPINALCIIQNTIFTRQFRFALLSKVTFASSLISGVVAIGMALAGCGVWSLVGQRVSALIVKALLLWTFSSWRPTAAYDGQVLRAMAPYSLKLLSTDLISALYNNISQLFVGKMYSTNTLGYFNQGQKLKDLPVSSVLQSVQSVTFPALSKIGGDERKFAESYRQVMMMVAFALFPMMTGLLAIANDLFALLLGEKWMPTVPYFEILCLAGLFAPLAMVSYNVLKVKSNGSIIVKLEVLKKIIMTAILALTIPHSVLAIAWGLSAMALIEMCINFIATTRYVCFSLSQFIRTLLPAALLSGVMFGVVRLFLQYTDFPLPLRLLSEIVVGAGVYILLAFVFRLEAMKIVCELLRRQFTAKS